MDNEADAIRARIDETLSGLTHKLTALEHQVVGTVGTVKSSMNTVRDSVDIKLQVRQRPWTIVAGASLLGFLGGFHSWRNSAGPRRSGLPAEPFQSEAASVAQPQAAGKEASTEADGPSWMNTLSTSFQPELAQLKGVAVSILIQFAHEIIASRVSDPVDSQEPGSPTGNVSDGEADDT